MKKSRLFWELGLLGACIVGFAVFQLTRPRTPERNLYQPLQKMAQPVKPITKIEAQSVKEAWDSLHEAELILGVKVNGQARAYPINMITGPSREIINDSLGGRPIAATW